MPDVLLTEATQILAVAEEATQILAVAEQGPPGPPGPPGSGGATGALLIDNRLNEFAADPAAQQQARDNLGIPPNTPAPAHIDGGSF